MKNSKPVATTNTEFLKLLIKTWKKAGKPE